MDRVKKAIASILERQEYLLDTPRNVSTRKAARDLLDAVVHTEEVFCKFSSALIERIEKLFPAKRRKRSPREKVLSSFQTLRFGKLEELWDNLYKSLDEDITIDSMMKQFTNEQIFNEAYVSYFSQIDRQKSAASSSNGSSTASSSNGSSTALTGYQRDIVRYIAGYVPLKLFRKYEKKNSSKASSYVECLSHMKVRGSEGSLATYATAWIEEVNRGGLFEVNDAAYSLFLMLEKIIHEGSSAPLILSKEELIKKVDSNVGIQQQWSLLSVDIEEDEWAQELLIEICVIWQSIRCNALTRRWMETYKQRKKKSTRKSKSLRKNLKKIEEKKQSDEAKQEGKAAAEEERMEAEAQRTGEEEEEKDVDDEHGEKEDKAEEREENEYEFDHSDNTDDFFDFLADHDMISHTE